MDLAQLQTLMLLSVRVIAFLVVAPPFAYKSFPGTVKAMLGIGIAIALLPRLNQEPVEYTTGGYIIQLAVQAFIGAALGFCVYLVFAAVQSAGSLIDLQGGFSMAQSFDPANNVNGAQFNRMLNMTALALVFATGAYQTILGGLFRSFDYIPPGAPLDLTQLGDTVTKGFSSMFVGAVQIAGPLMVILILADLGLGLLTRVAPALNVFVLSFPLKIYLTLSLVSIVYLTMPSLVERLTGASISAIWDVVR